MPVGRPTVLITGASGFIGGAIASRLIERATVRSLTGHPERNRFGDRVASFAYDFDHPARMAAAFQGVDVFVNSYYVRFEARGWKFERAVDRARVLVETAREAGINRIVQISVSNADERSDLPYYRNKGLIEHAVRESGVTHAILRPAVVVGPGDTLVNNIAFFLRRLPVFTLFVRGEQPVQPMTLEAFSEIAVEAIDGAYDGRTIATAGPVDWTFSNMVRAVARAVDSRALIVPVPPVIVLAGLKVAGVLLRDVVLTRDEIAGVTSGYLRSSEPLRRGLDFGEWLRDPWVSAHLGRRYRSESARH